MDNVLLNNPANPKTYWEIIKSNKANTLIPMLHNLINDQHIDDIAYADLDVYELLDTYFCDRPDKISN